MSHAHLQNSGGMSAASTGTGTVPLLSPGNENSSTSLADVNQQIQLRWTSHQPTIFNVFQTLYNSEHMVDVTLAAEGKYLRAHKIILSACSPYFQELLSLDCSTKHPILFMSPDVKFKELKAVLNYMYKGETNIHQAELQSLLRLADALRIRGLAETSDTTPNLGMSAAAAAPPPPESQRHPHPEFDPLGYSPDPRIIPSTHGPIPVPSAMSHSSSTTTFQSSTSNNVVLGMKHKLNTSVADNFSSVLLHPNDSTPFRSPIPNPLEIPATGPGSAGYKRRRCDAQLLTTSTVSSAIQSVPLVTEITTTQTNPLSYPNPNQVFHQELASENDGQYGIMESEEVEVDLHEVKVDIGELNKANEEVVVGLFDESSSSHLGGDHSVEDFDDDGEGDEERSNWSLSRNRGHGSGPDFQIASTSSSLQDKKPEGILQNTTKSRRENEFDYEDQLCEYMDLGDGLLVERGIIQHLIRNFITRPPVFMKKLCFQVLGIEYLSTCSLSGKKSKAGFCRPAIDPVKLNILKEFTISTCQLKPNTLEMTEFFTRMKNLCTSARKELKKIMGLV